MIIITPNSRNNMRCYLAHSVCHCSKHLLDFALSFGTLGITGSRTNFCCEHTCSRTIFCCEHTFITCFTARTIAVSTPSPFLALVSVNQTFVPRFSDHCTASAQASAASTCLSDQFEFATKSDLQPTRLSTQCRLAFWWAYSNQRLQLSKLGREVIS